MNHEIETCSHNSEAPVLMLEQLADSQAGKGRHKCPICAYKAGLQAGIEEGIRRIQQALSTIPTDA